MKYRVNPTQRKDSEGFTGTCLEMTNPFNKVINTGFCHDHIDNSSDIPFNAEWAKQTGLYIGKK